MKNKTLTDALTHKDQTAGEWKSIIAGTLLTTCGLAVYILMPLHLGAMMTALQLTAAQAGILSGSEYYAMGAASLFAPLWIRRFNWQKMALFSSTMACIGHIATIISTDFELIVAARIFTGLFGQGILYAISFAVLAETRNPDRSFGIAIAVATLITAFPLWNGPLLLDLFGRNSVIIVLLGITLLLLPVIKFTPTGSNKTQQNTSNTASTTFHHKAWIPVTGLAALALWYVGPGGFWAFSERIADSQGISSSEISTVFALAVGISITGPLLAAGIGDRFGRMWPVFLSTTLMTLIVLAFSNNIINNAFMPSFILFNVLMGISCVYLFGLIAIIDTTGKLNVLTPAFQAIGEGTGPLIMGYLVGSYGYATVGWSYSAFALIALLLLFPVIFHINNSASSTVNTIASKHMDKYTG
jgi:DHA1 family inner membrane transport protein